MVSMKVHQIRVDFQVTEQISRFVYVYILESEYLYLIDTGVYGSEKQILKYLSAIGREASQIREIFLTHAHPDHIGTAAWFQEHTRCKIYASEGEKPWIEDINLQFRERPIPNFYQLAGKSSRVDRVVRDGEEISLEEGLSIKVIRTAGHSCDEVSYLAEGNLFIGDSVPVKGDIPIFIGEQEMRNTLSLLEKLEGVHTYYPAWDETYSRERMMVKLCEGRELIDQLKAAVLSLDDGADLGVLVERVCESLQMPMLKANPLFSRTVECLR